MNHFQSYISDESFRERSSIRSLIFPRVWPLQHKKPEYIYEKYSKGFNYTTRYAELNTIRRGNEMTPELELSRSSFCPIAGKAYNELLRQVTSQKNVNKFKIIPA